MNIKSGVKNISYSFVGQIITLLIGFFIPRFVITSYGSEVNGLLQSVGTIISYLSLLEAGVGTVTCQALYKPISENDRTSINGILSATNFYYKRAGAVYAILTVLIALIFPLTITTELSYWFMVAIVLICGVPGVVSFLFQRKYMSFLESIGENYIVINLQTTITVASSLSKIILIKLGQDVITVQLVYTLITMIQMVFILWYIKRKYKWIDLHEKPKKEALSQKGGAFIHQICGLVTNSTDVLVLSMFCDLKVVSIYAVYNMVFSLIYNSILSVNSGILYAIGQAYCKGKEYYKGFIDVYETGFVTVASSLLTVAYIMIYPFLTLYTEGADIDYLDKYLPMLFLAVNFMNSCRNSSINTISVAGKFVETQKYAIIESIINLSVSVLSVWKFGMPGVLVGTIVAFSYRCVMALYYSNCVILERKALHSIKTIGLNLLLILIAVFVSSKFSITVDNYFIFFAYAAVVGIGVVVIFILINAICDLKAFFEIKNYVMSFLKKSGD